MLPIIPQGGYWFFAAGVPFHATADGVIDFSEDGAGADGDWVTIGGGPGPHGQQHAGGFPAKVKDGQVVGGKIAGKLGLHGKNISDVADHLSEVNKHRKDGKSLSEAVSAADDRSGSKAAGAAGGPVGDALDRSAVLPTPPGQDLKNGLYLFEGRAGQRFLVDPRRTSEALAMAAKLDDVAADYGKKRGKKNRAEAEDAKATAADIRSQVEILRGGRLPDSHTESHEDQRERDERAKEGAERRRAAVASSLEKNRPKYEHLKAFVDEHGYFPMPGTMLKGGRKYMGTSAQRLRLTEDGLVQVWTGSDLSKPHEKWVTLTDDLIHGALKTAGWTGKPTPPPAPPKDRLGTIKDAAERLVVGGTSAHHELHAALVKAHPDLTYGEFRDSMTQLRDEGRLVGRPWDKTIYEHPHPETLHFGGDGKVYAYAEPGPNVGKSVFGLVSSGGRWFYTNGAAFHADDAGQIDFVDGTEGEGQWITIGGGLGEKGERHVGGFPAKVTGGTPDSDGKLRGGTIVGGKIAGKLGLHGLSTTDVADHLAEVNEHRDSGKTLAQAVKIARERRVSETKTVDDVPHTERASSWWGPNAGRYHWSSGGVLISDGWAAQTADGRPGIHTAPRSPATVAPGGAHAEDNDELVRARDARPGGTETPEVRGARGELYAMARAAGNQSDFYYRPVGAPPAEDQTPGQARWLDAVRYTVGPSYGEKQRVLADFYRRAGAGESPADVSAALTASAAASEKGSHRSDEVAGWVRHAAQMVGDVLKRYGLDRVPRDPWLDDKNYRAGGSAPAGTTWQGLVAGLKGHEHGGYQRGVGWIARHNGELVSSKAATNGSTIETYRVRFPDRDLLVTWGRSPASDQRSGQLPPAWDIVHDKVKEKSPGERDPAVGPRKRIWGHSPVYLTGSANPKVAAELKGHAGFGVLLTPATKGYVKYLKDFKQFGIDNGCFSKAGEFDEAEFLNLVKTATEDPDVRAKCLFAVAPDVYDPTFDNGPGKDKGRGDPLKTIERSLPVLPKIRALGVPAALVAQDGLEDHVDKIPWDAFDVLFIGGSTEFKLLYADDAKNALKAANDPTLPKDERDRIALEQNRNLKWLNLMWQVRAHGKSIHVGRVNSLARMAISHAFGAESADGTFLAFGPDKNLPRMKNWMKTFEDCTDLANAIASGTPIPEHMQKTYDKLTGVKPKKKSKPKKAATVVAAGFARTPNVGEVFSVLAAQGVQGAREYLSVCDPAGRRDLAGFLLMAVGTQTTLAVPAVVLLSVVREVAEESGDEWAVSPGSEKKSEEREPA